MRSKYKIVFLGNQNVGKTTLISQFVYEQADAGYHPTIGIDFLSTKLDILDKEVRLQLWDTAGQERFNSIIPNYTRDCFIAVIVYDVCNKESFMNINHWVNDLVRINDHEEKVKIIVVGNKKDCLDKWEKEMVNSKSLVNNENKDEIPIVPNENASEVKNDKVDDDTTKNEALKIDNNDKLNPREQIIEMGNAKAKEFNGKFVLTCAMNHEDIEELVSVIHGYIEEDIKECGNVIELGKKGETIKLEATPRRRFCFF